MERYEITCRCGYHYWVESFGKPMWEICPNCGFSRPFNGKEVSKCGAGIIKNGFPKGKPEGSV